MAQSKTYLKRILQCYGFKRSSSQVDDLLLKLKKKCKKNSFILIFEKDELIKIRIFLAAIDLDLVPIVMPNGWSEQRVAKVLDRYNRSYLVKNLKLTVPRSRQLVEKKLKKTYGVFSSGSTGYPEISFLSVKNAKKNAIAHSRSLGLSKKSQIIKILSVDHSFGIIAYIWTPLVLQCKVKQLDPFLGWESLQELDQKNLVLHLTPTWLRFLNKTKLKTHSISGTISIGAGYASDAEINQIYEFNRNKIFITYGLTEAGPRVLTGQWSPGVNRHKEYSFIGKPLRGIRLKILDINNKIKNEGNGWLLIKSASLKKNIKQNELIKGYLKTRDFCYLDKTSRVYKKIDNIFFTKFRDQIIDFNYISSQLNSKCIGVFWKKRNDMHWALIYESEKSKELSIKDVLNKNIYPNKILHVKKIKKTSLNKLDKAYLCELLRIEIAQNIQIFYCNGV